jgi:hypothetical protein
VEREKGEEEKVIEVGAASDDKREREERVKWDCSSFPSSSSSSSLWLIPTETREREPDVIDTREYPTEKEEKEKEEEDTEKEVPDEVKRLV